MQLLTVAFLLVSTQAVVLPRQVPSLFDVPKSFEKIASTTAVAPVLSDILPAQAFPEAIRKQVVWGPYTAQSAKDQNGRGSGGIKLDQHSDLFEYNLAGLCSNCLVLSARIDLTDKTGKKLPLHSEIYTHHIIVSNMGKRTAVSALTSTGVCDGLDSFKGVTGLLGSLFGDIFKPKGSAAPKSLLRRQFGPNTIFGPSTVTVKGHEGNSVNWASYNNTGPKSGLWIAKDDKILNSVEIVNYKDVPQDVYFTIDAEYLNFDSQPKDYLGADFYSMVAMDCADPLMRPPKDKAKTYTTPVHSVLRDTYLVDFHPHLHDGAINMKFHVNGKVVCTREALYGEDSSGFKLNGQVWETIEEYTPCVTIPLKKGDKVQMSADYDLTKRRLRPSSGDHHMDADSMAMAFVQLATPI